MQKLPLLRFANLWLPGAILLISTCQQSWAEDELHGHVQSSSTPRISRPATKEELADPALSGQTSTRPLNAHLDDNSFDLSATSNQTNLDLSNWNPWGRAGSNCGRPFNGVAMRHAMLRPAGVAQTVLTGGDQDLSQVEMRWKGSVSEFDNGCSHVRVSANIAFCPPADPVMREDWRTLMRELQNESSAAMWRQWQETVCQQLMVSKLTAMGYGTMSMHVAIKNNGDIAINGHPMAVMNNDFADSCRASVNDLKTAGWLVLPPASAVHQAHLRLTIQVRPVNMP